MGTEQPDIPTLLERIGELERLVARLVEYEDGSPDSWPEGLEDGVSDWYRPALEITRRLARENK